MLIVLFSPEPRYWVGWLWPWYQPFTAETVTFWSMKHKSKRKTTFRITNWSFNHHVRVTGVPDGFLEVLFAVFVVLPHKSLVLFEILHFLFLADLASAKINLTILNWQHLSCTHGLVDDTFRTAIDSNDQPFKFKFKIALLIDK